MELSKRSMHSDLEVESARRLAKRRGRHFETADQETMKAEDREAALVLSAVIETSLYDGMYFNQIEVTSGSPGLLRFISSHV